MEQKADMALGHVPRQKLAETVAQQLLEAVRDLDPGTRLPTEQELTKSLGVGRSTVREALNGLSLMGLVEIRHGQGTFVADRAQVHLNAPAVTQMSDDLLEARQIIEVELARLAAERHTDEDIAKMEALLDKHEKHLAANEGPIIEASRFHLLVADAARNKILADMIRPFFQIAFERGPQLYQTMDGYAEWELDQHRRILEAIESGDGDLARSRMFDHVTSMRAHYSGDGSGS